MLWLLEELGLQYDVKFYRRVGGLAPPELKAVHPLGKSPVISDGELVLAESGAITEYLCETYDPEGKFHPLSSEKRAWIDHRYWLHYSEGSLAGFLVLQLIMDRIEVNTPWLVRPVGRGISSAVKSNYITPNLDSNAAYLDAAIAANGGYLVSGRFTAADIQLSGSVGELLKLPGYSEKHPGLVAYLERLKARPAYKRAAQRDDAFTAEKSGKL